MTWLTWITLKLYLVRILILIDCIINWILAGSINETLSARAHRMRVKKQKYTGWLAGFIDGIFFWQPHHCQTSHEREVATGGALMWLPSLVRPARLWPEGAKPIE